MYEKSGNQLLVAKNAAAAEIQGVSYVLTLIL